MHSNDTHNDPENGSRSDTVIAVAGAAGFIGSALTRSLMASNRHVVGLSRAERWTEHPQLSWRQCDLFLLTDAMAALEGVQVAVYLVHSMQPSARLTQASFMDMDLIAADNFARAAAAQGVEHIVYLGGLMPPEDEGDGLSDHLRSRLEVEQTLAAHGVPVTTLRAGLILGPGGSSTQLLIDLVQRLPVLACPPWTDNMFQPIALGEMVELLHYAIDHPELAGQAWDVGTEEAISYRELLKRTAHMLGLERTFVSVPFTFRNLAVHITTLLVDEPRSLVEPLLASLQHTMLARDRRLQERAGTEPISIDEGLRSALEDDPLDLPGRRRARRRELRGVRSVQRMTLPEGKSAAWACEEYMRWLPRFTLGLIATERNAHGGWDFKIRWTHLILLSFYTDADQSNTPDRTVMCITDGVGLLVRDHPTDRLEFRQVLGERTLLVAVQDFQPRLWWILYLFTQAQLHLGVMLAYGYHLRHWRPKAANTPLQQTSPPPPIAPVETPVQAPVQGSSQQSSSEHASPR
ncbi:MAG: NAD-dependent epimerase/dehydratase family protein [Myxococcota bacterium]